jgi:hypothetical protein
MKAKIIKEETKKEFKPFKIELEVESLDEAVKLLKVFDHADIIAKINDGWYIDDIYICENTKRQANAFKKDIASVIKKEIESQGFEV